MIKLMDMKKCLFWSSLIVAGLFPSCLPVYDPKVIAVFLNNTEDTLFIAATHYDNVDSVERQLRPRYLQADSSLDTSTIFLWNGCNVEGNHVYPDSSFTIDGDFLFNGHDSCYFFLVKWRDAKRYSWKEIRSRKLYRRVIITRDKDGKFDTDIKYK